MSFSSYDNWSSIEVVFPRGHLPFKTNSKIVLGSTRVDLQMLESYLTTIPAGWQEKSRVRLTKPSLTMNYCLYFEHLRFIYKYINYSIPWAKTQVLGVKTSRVELSQSSLNSLRFACFSFPMAPLKQAGSKFTVSINTVMAFFTSSFFSIFTMKVFKA